MLAKRRKWDAATASGCAESGLTLSKKMGTVDVERYTGPCLISTAVRGKAKRLTTESGAGSENVMAPNDPRNWAGVPLVSMAASIRKNPRPKKDASRNQHWRPAFQPPEAFAPLPCNPHSLQGAPLIRVPRPPGDRKNPVPRRNPTPQAFAVNPPTIPPPLEAMTGGSCGVSSSDCSSVTSDEASAGSSESSLPRIIKPRKRRKKERRMAWNQRTDETCGDLSSSFLRMSLNSADPWHPEDVWSVWKQPDSSASSWSCNSTSPNSCWPDLIDPAVRNADRTPDPATGSTSAPSGSLEVSSQIITSPYGHRDIEIRFFSR